jgi:hypothetical protein
VAATLAYRERVERGFQEDTRNEEILFPGYVRRAHLGTFKHLTEVTDRKGAMHVFVSKTTQTEDSDSQGAQPIFTPDEESLFDEQVHVESGSQSWAIGRAEHPTFSRLQCL